MILLSKTFSEVTPESAENGETSDSGFVWENSPHTFRELIYLLREHATSSSTNKQKTVHDWFSTDWSIEDYSTVTERQESIHFSHTNTSRAEKYWIKAIAYVFG